jgi:mono/diheme cytochrome c family protein
MKRWLLVSLFLVLFTAAVLYAGHSAQAAGLADVSVPRGGALYDKWYAVLGSAPPTGNMPLWGNQTTNTASGEDTWRCVTCHGWDYQGKDGAYRSGSNFTVFPGLYQIANQRSFDEILAALKGGANPQHDFSKYMDDASLNDLANFVDTALIDDNQYIDKRTLEVIGGDATGGRLLYDKSCASCHGADGTTLKFRFEGTDATLGTLAAKDPWRFLHKTRFGTPGTPMTIGFDLGWTAQEGRDVLRYAQTFPNGIIRPTQPPTLDEHEIKPNTKGGPANNFLSGLLTIFGAMTVGLGFNILIAAALVGIILLIVWILRGRKS